MKLTEQQERICNSKAHTLKVKAYTGTGKSTTLEKYARARPQESMLYVAFNANIRDEAKTRFPRHVRCMTWHGLAFPEFGTRYQHKMGVLKPHLVGQFLGITSQEAVDVIEVLKSFMISAFAEFSPFHIGFAGIETENDDRLLELAQRLWEAMCDVRCLNIPMVHDGYFKLWHLNGVTLPYDRLLFDEAQDANPILIDIVRRQTCGKVIVGDHHQSIYSFRGAINAMDQFDADETLPLSISYRFGPDLADLASRFLADWRNEKLPLTGKGPYRTQWRVDENLPHAVLTRSNAGLFDEVVKLIRAGRPFHLIGGISRYKFGLVQAASKFKQGERDAEVERQFDGFTDWNDYRGYAYDTDDKEALMVIRVVDRYKTQVSALVEEIGMREVASGHGHVVSLTTAHGSKGLEFDNVILAEDFPRLVMPSRDGQQSLPSNEEINLLYMASTRARRSIRLNQSMLEWLHAYGHSDLLETIQGSCRPVDWTPGCGFPMPSAIQRRYSIAIRKLRSGLPLNEDEQKRVADMLETAIR